MDLILDNGTLKLTMSAPGTYYQGTRFDWAGVFRSIECDGTTFADVWFDGDDPKTHDHLCGTSEEFLPPLGYDEAAAGESFLKIGVGLLKKEADAPYDWFHTYEIADAGLRTLALDDQKVEFKHILCGFYEYSKCVELSGPRSFRISHRLLNTGSTTLNTEQYNHNFFTFGLPQVGPERSVEFGFPIEGKWREGSVKASKNDTAIRITSPLEAGEKAYMGGIHAVSDYDGGYSFTLKAGDRSVRVRSDHKLSSAVFWSNHRVFCPEPYISLNILPGLSESWSIDYELNPGADTSQTKESKHFTE